MSEVYEIVLQIPAVPDFQELATSTSLPLKVLRPWCKAEHSSIALRSIKLQVQSYNKAIDFSIVAAERGHTIAEEALGFAKNIDEAAFSDEERQSYLRGMLDMACRGEKDAQKAHEKFREVGSTLERVIRGAREEHSQGNASPGHTNDNDLNHLENNNKMKMRQPSLATRFQHLFIDYNSLHQKAVVQTWEQLKASCVDYCDQIKGVQDADEDLARELQEAPREAEQKDKQREESGLLQIAKPEIMEEPKDHETNPEAVQEGSEETTRVSPSPGHEQPQVDGNHSANPLEPAQDKEKSDDSEVTAVHDNDIAHENPVMESSSGQARTRNPLGPLLPPPPILIPILSRPPSRAPSPRPLSTKSVEKEKEESAPQCCCIIC